MIIFDKFLPFKGGIKLLSEYEVRKTARVGSKSIRNDMAKVVKWSSSKFNTIAVPAYNFKELRDYGGFYEYSYDMPRLGRLNKEQKNIVRSVTSCLYGCWDYPGVNPFNLDNNWDCPSKDPFNPDNLSESEKSFMDESWSNHRDLMMLLLKVHKENRYHDLHEGNVMIYPDDGDPRLIDLEGFIMDDYNIDWIDNCIIQSN